MIFNPSINMTNDAQLFSLCYIFCCHIIRDSSWRALVTQFGVSTRCGDFFVSADRRIRFHGVTVTFLWLLDNKYIDRRSPHCTGG